MPYHDKKVILKNLTNQVYPSNTSSIIFLNKRQTNYTISNEKQPLIPKNIQIEVNPHYVKSVVSVNI